MKRLTRLRPSRPTVIALTALFVALTGTAVADSLVTGGDVKNNSITGNDIKNFSLLKKDFKRGQLPRGAQGPQGPQGVPGAPGHAGRDGFGTLEYVYGQGASTESVEQIFDYAECPPGTYVVGGGVLSTAAVPGDMLVNSSFPGDERTWLAYVDNLTVPTDVDDFRGALAYAICANASNVVPLPVLAKPKLDAFKK